MRMSEKTGITLTINGRDHAISVEPRRTLADAIREDCGQTGTHIGCEHGVCGACTVIVDGEPVRSCLMFAVQAPQTPCSQPIWVPVCPQSSRIASARVRRG